MEHLARMQLWLQQSSGPKNINWQMTYWLWQVRLHTINAHIRLRNYKKAVQELRGLLDESQARQTDDLDKAVLADLQKAEVVLLTRLSRVLLQVRSILLMLND